MKLSKLLIPLLALFMATLACSLTAEAPPTLPPRTPIGLANTSVPQDMSQATVTPQQGIVPQATVDTNTGVKPPSSGDVPSLPTSVAVAAPSITSPSFSAQVQSIDQNRLMNTVTTLVNFDYRHTFSYTDIASGRGIGAARDYIISQLIQIQLDNPNNRIDVDTHQYTFPYNGQSHNAENLVLIINGNDPTAGIIIIGAHYDTINDANALNPSLSQPGANDNASGVAAMIEIARIMAQTPHRASIIFVFFSGEELGRYGSRAYLEEYIQYYGLDRQVRAMINLDTIGSASGPDGNYYNDSMRIFSAGPNNSSSRQVSRMIEFAARNFLPDIRVDIQDALDRPNRWGDHQTFSDAGIPAIRLIEQADEPLKFHNASDNLDEIDPVYLQRTTQVALISMLMLADGPPPPTNITLDTSTWRLEWAPSAGATNQTRYLVAMRRNSSLVFEQELIAPTNGFSNAVIQNYDVIAIATIDENGQVGPFSQEFYVSNAAPAVASER